MDTKKITQDDINRMVWKACDTFRGVIDPSQYKDYILTMLFLKYVSDVYKSKFQDYVKKYEEMRLVRKEQCVTKGLLCQRKVLTTIFTNIEMHPTSEN